MKIETVPNDRAIWQSENAKTYRCPTCLRPVFTQHEGDDEPTRIICGGPLEPHIVEWR